jgi:signal peptidase I
MSFNFPLILVIAVAVCGALALLDLLLLAPRRRTAIATYEGQVSVPDEQILQRLNKEPLLVEYGKSFFPVLAIVLVLRSFLLEPFQIPSGSMKPTLEVGDFILVNKFAYGIRLPVIDTKIVEVGDPQRGDVMVFRYPSDPSINYIKRVIGLPGDRLVVDGKQVYVNGVAVPKTYLFEKLDDDVEGRTFGGYPTARFYSEQLGEVNHQIRERQLVRGISRQEWVVPQGHYFMMGDNRDNSKDSRFWEDPPGTPPEFSGMVPDRNIVGKAFAVWMSWPNPKLKNLPNFSRVGLIR